MSHNRYHGIESYAVSFASYKAKLLIRTPLFTDYDFEDLQQDLIIAYLHAWPSFNANKGDRRSFIKSVINNASQNILVKAEASKSWSGVRNISLFENVEDDIELIDILPNEDGIDVSLKIDLESSLKDMPDELQDLFEHLKTQSILEISTETGIHKQTLVSRLKRLRKYLRDKGL